MFDIDKLNIYWNGQSDLFNVKEDEDFNELLNIEKQILLHPRNAHMLFMPVIDDLLKQDARKEIIGNLKGLPLKDPTTFLQSLTPQKNVEKGITFVKSKFGVGIVALDITGHALFMVDNININQSYNNPNNDYKATSTKLLFQGMGDNYSLTSMYDTSGRIISEVQSQTMNSQVDAGKDPYAVGLGINSQTLNMFMYLNRRGVPAIITLKFLNQPLIQEYLEAQRENESLINKQRGEELRKDELIDMVYTRNELGRPQLNRNLIITERDLNNGIKSKAMDVTQAQFFEYFLALVDEVSAFNDLKNSMTVDTKGKKDKASVENFKALQEKVEATGMIDAESLKRIRTEGVLSAFYQAQNLYEQLYFPFYVVDSSKFGEPLKAFRDMLEQRQRGQYLKDRVRSTVENDFLVFLIHNYHPDFTLQKFNELFGFTDENSIAKQIQDLQKNPNLRSNPVINALYPLLSIAKDSNQNQLFDVVRLFERELTSIDLNDFVDAMRDIKTEVSEDFYKSIIQLGIYQAGFMNSPFSLNKIFPTFETSIRENGNLKEFKNDYLREIQLSIIKQVPQLAENAETIVPAFQNLFYLNNPQFLPKRYWAKSPIKYFYLWNKTDQKRILKYINGNTNVELQPLGNTYFKRYFIELLPNTDLTPTPSSQPEGQKNNINNLPMQPDNIEMIKSGRKTQTIRKEKIENGIYRLSDGTLVELNLIGVANVSTIFGNKEKEEVVVNIKISNFETDEYSGDQFAQAEGFKDWNDFVKNNKYSSKFINKEESRYVYSIKIQSQPQQIDLFSQLTEPLSSMEDQMFLPEEIEEAKEKKEQCKGTKTSSGIDVITSTVKKAAKGMVLGFTPGGTWSIVEDLKGFPTHADGGVIVNIDSDGVNIAKGSSKIYAKNGLVICNCKK